VGYNPFARPDGPIYYDASAEPDTRLAPLSLYCVTPANRIPAVPNGDGRYEQVPNSSCPSFTPPRDNRFISRLTFTFSIGPDF
jgi:hypothetical protein